MDSQKKKMKVPQRGSATLKKMGPKSDFLSSLGLKRLPGANWGSNLKKKDWGLKGSPVLIGHT